MARQVDKVNVNNDLLSENIVCVTHEECHGDNLTDNEVHISETAIIGENAELQDHLWHDHIKREAVCTVLKDIKAELLLSEVLETVQNDNIKIVEPSGEDTRIKFHNGLLCCKHGHAYYEDFCVKCGMSVHIFNKHALNNADGGKREDDLPNDILEIQDLFGQFGIYAQRIIPAGTKFGSFIVPGVSECPWNIKGGRFVMNKYKSKYLNWMQFINPTRKTSEQKNLHVLQYTDNLYYQFNHEIEEGDEFLVYFDEEYASSLNKNGRVDFVTSTKHAVKNVFACTFRSLGFSSKSYLSDHKTIWLKDATQEFSIEELTLCSFCKIHSDPKKYWEYHMTYCSKMNDRKYILPTLSKETTTASGHKPRRRIVYKCEKLKYSTNFKGVLFNQTNGHYLAKTSKSEIYNGRFKTTEALRLHVKNTHISVGGKKDPEHSRSVYKNSHIKVEYTMYSLPQDQMNRFKCSLCKFRSKYERALNGHIKTKHLEKIGHERNRCEFRTNHKDQLEKHIKTKHLTKLGHKSDECQCRTDCRDQLQKHIKTKHFKEFDHKCDNSEFRTYLKHNLESHIKTKHLKEFDFKCYISELRTNTKERIERHMKTKHLKEFYYDYYYNIVCVSYEFRTNTENYLELHVKIIHLKEFYFKCDSRECRTNLKQNLEMHLKAKHLREFALIYVSLRKTTKRN